MPKVKISEFDTVAANNTDIDGINLAEGMLPSDVNNAIRELMSQLKDFQAGTASDPFNGAVNGTIGATTPAAGNFTTVDTTNLEVTNIKAKDGTASATIADSTGVMTVASSVLTTTDINGGTIDNTAVGATTRSTGAFTTLTSNGATTFTANTASTTTTTGTAVITGGLGVSGRINAANFDGIVGANTAAAGNFTTLGATGVATFSAGTVSAPAITTTGDTNTGIFFPAADTIAFTEGGTERMRILSSGGVSIGNTTDSGTGVLNVNNSILTPFAKLTANGTGSSNAGLLLDYSGVVQWQIYPETTTGALTIVSAGAIRLKIDTSGNVGIGTSSPAAKLDVAGSIKTLGYTVATLPAGVTGMRAYVTDALAPSFGVTVAGSGAVTIPVFYNGANWIVA